MLKPVQKHLCWRELSCQNAQGSLPKTHTHLNLDSSKPQTPDQPFPTLLITTPKK